MQQLYLTPDEKKALADWLASDETAENAMAFAQLQGYLFALICAPEPLDVEVWVKQAVGDDLSQLSQDHLFALMALHNEMSEQVFDTGFQLPDYFKVAHSLSPQMLVQSEAQLWSLGFAQGAKEYTTALLKSDELPEEFATTFSFAYHCLAFLAEPDKLAASATKQGHELAQYCHHMLTLMADFSLGFAELVEAAALASGFFQDDDWQEN